MLLGAAMVRTLYAKATLRRDKVYALLGIVRDGTETVPTPNYVQDDVHIFDEAHDRRARPAESCTVCWIT